MNNALKRCAWLNDKPRMIAYHDGEWGVPERNDRKLFEMFVLSGFQAGLSWEIILNKREGFRAALAAFDPAKIARFTARDLRRLVGNPAIIRNRLKLEAGIHNAGRFLAVQEEFDSFSQYLWRFVGGKTIHNRRRSQSSIPTHSRASDAMSIDLKERGFKFAGTTICYAFMQSVGMVNDHLTSCFRHVELSKAVVAGRRSRS